MISRARPALLVALLLGGCGDGITDPPLPPLADLPADLAAVELTATGRLSVPYVMLEVRRDEGFRGFVAVNGDGRPVWFHRTEGSPHGFTRRADGNLVLLDNERGLVEVRPADGAVVRELAQEARPGRFLHHDVTATPDNTILFLAEDVRAVGDEMVTGEALWEWVPETDVVARRWSSFDHLDWVLDRGPRSVAHDWLHANSIAFGPDGNVLVSLHFLNQVISIAPGFDALEWRLGGTRATIPVEDPFSGQHTARSVGPDRILLFDNGFERVTERYSRAVEYSIADGTGRIVWEWRPERDNWARVISGAQRMSNGHTLVGFGTAADLGGLGTTGPIEVYEVNEGGAVVWHLLIEGEVSSMYRATPLDRL